MEISLTKKQRIEWIDIAKGIAIVAMIIGHSVEYGGTIRNFIFSFHMPLFFILSGYTYKIPETMHDLMHQLKKDLRHIYLPCLVTVWIYQVLRTIADGNGFDLIFIVRKLIWGNGCSYTRGDYDFLGIGAIWFLIALLLAKLLYGFFQMRAKDHEIIGFYIVLAYVGILIGRKIWLTQNLDIVLIAVLFLHVGRLLKTKEEQIRRYVIALSCISAVIWLWMLENGRYIEMATRQYPMGILCILEAVCGTFLVIQASKFLQNLRIIKEVFVFLGRHTLEILCIHSLDSVFWQWRQDNYLSRVVFDICMMIGYVIIKKCFLILIKKMKMIRNR